MTKDQIESLVGSWLNTTLEEAEEARANSGPLDDDEWEGQHDILGDQLEEAHGALTLNKLTSVEGIADGLLTAQGISIKKDSSAYRRLCRELLKAKMDMLKTEMQRMDGEYTAAPTVHRNGSTAGATPSIAPVTKLFSVAAEAYMKEHSNRRPRTQDMIRAGFAKFLAATGGDRPIGNISKDECRTYKEHMTAAKLTAATVNKHLYCLSHFLSWAGRQGLAPKEWKTDNPVIGLTIAKRIVKAGKVKTIPFSDAALSIIFSSERSSRSGRPGVLSDTTDSWRYS